MDEQQKWSGAPVHMMECLKGLTEALTSAMPEQRSELVDQVAEWCRRAGGKGEYDYLTGLFKRRRSIRQYGDQAIPDQILTALREATVYAATSRNQQARRFAFLQDRLLRQALVQQCGMQPFVATAPLVIAGCATSRTSQGAVADVLISLTQLEAIALSAGLGTCWLGIFEAASVHRLLRLPCKWRVVMMMSVGSVAEEPAARTKLGLDEMTWFNAYKEGSSTEEE